jgi:hypothetical protein
MKNLDIILPEKKTKFLNKRYFVENKTDYAACFKNEVNFLAA